MPSSPTGPLLTPRSSVLFFPLSFQVGGFCPFGTSTILLVKTGQPRTPRSLPPTPGSLRAYIKSAGYTYRALSKVATKGLFIP